MKKEKIDNLQLVRGLFENTAEEALKNIGSVRLSHIDCDIYSAVKYSCNVSGKYMVDGSYWVFDDPLSADCIGAMEAVEETLIQRNGRFADRFIRISSTGIGRPLDPIFTSRRVRRRRHETLTTRQAS